MCSLILDLSLLKDTSRILSIKVPFILNGESYLLSYRPDGSGTVIHKFQSDDTKLVWKGKWSSGYTSLIPFYLNGEPYLFLYKFNGKKTTIDKFRAGGKGTTVTATENWAPGWDPIIPIIIRGQPHLLSFNKTEDLKEKVDLDKLQPKGKGTKNVWHHTEGDVVSQHMIYRD